MNRVISTQKRMRNPAIHGQAEIAKANVPPRIFIPNLYLDKTTRPWW